MRLTCGAECPVHRGSSAPTRRLRCKPDRASRARWSKQCSRRRTPEHAPSVLDRAPESDYFTPAVNISILGRSPRRPAPRRSPRPNPVSPGRPPPRLLPSRSPSTPAARPLARAHFSLSPSTTLPRTPLPSQLSPRPIPFPWQVALFPRPGYGSRERISSAVSIGKNHDSRVPARFDLAGLEDLAMHRENAFPL